MAAVLDDRFYWNFNVGPKGDTLHLENVALVIPEGALDRELTVTLAISCNAADMPKLSDGRCLLGPVIHCLPHGLHFDKPATLSFDYYCTAELQNPPDTQVWCR